MAKLSWLPLITLLIDTTLSMCSVKSVSCFPKTFKYDLDKCAVGPRYKLDRAAVAKVVHAVTPRLHQVLVREPCCKLTENNYETCKVTPTFRWFVPAFIFYSRIVTFVSIHGDFFSILWKYLLLRQ